MLSVLGAPIRRQQILLASVDLLILFVSLPVAVLVRGLGQPANLREPTLANLPAVVLDFFRYYTGATTIAIVVFMALFFVFDLYAPDRKYGSALDFAYVLFVSLLAVLAIPVLYYFAPAWRLGRGLLLLQALFVAVASYAWRLVYSRVHRRIARARRVLVIGAGGRSRRLLEEIQSEYRAEFDIVGALDDDPAKADLHMNGFRVVGGTRDVTQVCAEHGVEILVFAIPRERNPVDGVLMREILGLKTSGIEVYQLPTFFKKLSGRVPVEYIEDSWLVFGTGFSGAETGPAARVRRIFDVAFAAGALLVLAPVLVLVAIAVKTTSRGPVFYRQERLGLNRRPYTMLKFRSMAVDAEKGGGAVWSSGKSDSRVTAVGRFLRRTRLDEVPNFLNVLKGEMSVVGPRPERAAFVELLARQIPYYDLRFVVKPGLTGWAQVNYMYGASVDAARRKLEYDLFYIQQRSLFLDLVILLKTAQTVLVRPGS